MSNHVDDSCPEGPFVQTTKVHDDWYKPTPRVAESLDDLAVGMVVAWETDAGRVGGGTIYGFGQDCLVTGRNGGGDIWDKVKHGPVVILADPPAPPAPDWLVPADTMEALKRAASRFGMGGPVAGSDSGRWSDIVNAARAVLNAAREVAQ